MARHPGAGNPPNAKYHATPTVTGTRKRRHCPSAHKANQLFAQLVRNVPGVLRIESSEDETTGEPAFRVYVRPGDLDAEYRVYEAECDVYNQHPEAKLDVVVLKQIDAPEETPGASSQSR